MSQQDQRAKDDAKFSWLMTLAGIVLFAILMWIVVAGLWSAVPHK